MLALAHAFPRSPDDPVGLFVAQLAVALRDEGIDTTVLVPSAPGLPAQDTFAGIAVHRYRYAARANETLAYSGTMAEQVRSGWGSRLAFAGMLGNGLRHALRLTDQIGADLVHAHWWVPGGVVGAAVNAIRGTPLITTMHGTDVRLLDSGIGRTLFPLVAARSSALTAVSSWLSARAAATDHSTTNRMAVTVAPMPVRAEDFPPGPAARGPRLLFVGKLTEQKGLHFLLDAMAKCQTRPTLEIVGAGRVDDRALRDRALALGLAHRITWTPLLAQADLAVRYREARVLVIPAIDEGLGLTAVEAALSQTPVIAFASGGVVDTIIDGETGILVPPRAVDRLAAAIDRLIDDPAEAARLGGEGRRFALRRFGAEAVAATYAALYRRATRS